MAEAGIFQTQLSCSICLDILKDPVTYPCGHSYCMNCNTHCWIADIGGYSCAQCTYTLRPDKSVMEGMSLQTAHRNTGAEDVECDVCTGSKNKAVKSCLECQKSFCQNHLQQHENIFKMNEHNLMDPTRRLNVMNCSKHRRPLEVYCRTDQQLICYVCTMQEHKNHETVTAAAERTEKQRGLRERQRKVQHRIQEKEKELQEAREAVDSYKCSAQTAIKGIEKICTELMNSIKKTRSEVTQLIRAQEKSTVSQAEKLINQLQQDIVDLKRRDAEMERLSQNTDDIVNFMQIFQSVSVVPESTVSHNMTVSSLFSFDDMKNSVSLLKEKLENFCRERIEYVSDRVTYITFIRPNKPKTWMEFLQYAGEFKLDSNTINPYLCLSDGNRTATNSNIQQNYPYHPERFDFCAQVLSKESVCGRCYWEVEWTGSAGVFISMAYKTISRKSEKDECLFGHNDQSWGVYCSPFNYSNTPSLQLSIQDSITRAANVNSAAHSQQFQAASRQTAWTGAQTLGLLMLQKNKKTAYPVSSSCSRIGVFVDHSAGTLSFHNVSDTMTLIHRIQTTFTQPLYPGFTIYKGSTVKIAHLTNI